MRSQQFMKLLYASQQPQRQWRRKEEDDEVVRDTGREKHIFVLFRQESDTSVHR